MSVGEYFRLVGEGCYTRVGLLKQKSIKNHGGLQMSRCRQKSHKYRTSYLPVQLVRLFAHGRRPLFHLQTKRHTYNQNGDWSGRRWYAPRISFINQLTCSLGSTAADFVKKPMLDKTRPIFVSRNVVQD